MNVTEKKQTKFQVKSEYEVGTVLGAVETDAKFAQEPWKPKFSILFL